MSDRIAIVHDAHAALGPPDQSDTLVEAQAIAAELRALGFEPSIVPAGLDLGALERALAALAPRAVVNLVESLGGRGRLLDAVPALLESLELPFTGCSASAVRVTSDKLLAKRLLRAAGIAAPAAFGPGEPGERWIVKSVYEHASLGLDDASVVAATGVEAAIASRRAAHGGDWFAEEFVAGRELNVSLFAGEAGPRVLPVAEIRFDEFPAGKPRIVGYAAKWDTASFEYRATPRVFGVESALASEVGAVALDCWRLFALDGYARVDFRVDAAGEPWVLEVNANPCFSPDAGFAAALAEAGIGYREAVAMLVDDALARGARRSGGAA